MKIEMLVQLSEVGPKVGDIVEEEKARAVALVQAGYAKWLPEEEEPEAPKRPRSRREAPAPVEVVEE